MQASGSIVLSKLQISSDQYQVFSSAEDIVRFYSKNTNGDGVYETSPQVLKIDLYKNGTQIDFKGKYKLYCAEDERYTWTEDELEGIAHFGERSGNEGETDLIDPNTLHFEIQKLTQGNDFFQRSSNVFVFEYIENNNLLAAKAFQFRDGVSSELADFSVTAAAINANVRDARMSFTEEGLEIKNGGFKISKGDEQVLGFETKEIDGQSFSKLAVHGAIYADEGSFTGTIHATEAEFDSGEIGGFDISKDKLTSKPRDDGSVTLELDGVNGKIIARDIELGNGAKIEDSISLGQAKIYNPEKNDRKFIESGKIVIKDDGTAKIGEIELKGNESEIWGENWSIRKDSANFSNINVSGAIETAVFKTNSVQAAGGAMIFRPSYKGQLSVIENTVHILVEEEFLGNVGSKIQLILSDKTIYTGKIIAIDGRDLSIELDSFSRDISGSGFLIDYSNNEYIPPNEYYPIEEEIYYYKEGSGAETKYIQDEEIQESFSSFSDSKTVPGFLSSKNLVLSQKNEGFLSANKTSLVRKGNNLVNSIKNYYVMGETLLFGLNSGNVGVGWEGRILPKGLTLTSFKNGLYNPNLYLGDLKQLGLKGYGLYADNVFLNGSLTTQVGKQSYAGVNTVSGVNATVFGSNFEKNNTPTEVDTSKIVFWAGANSKEDTDIQKAFFQVTENGSIYAQRAKLVDTLMVGGALQATEIYTASLHGAGSGLNIYDGSEGINFISKENNILFSITPTGLGERDNEFIKISNNEVNFIGNHLRTKDGKNFLQLTTLAGNGGSITPVLQHIEGSNVCGIYFEQNSTSFKMGPSDGQKVLQTWDVNGTTFYDTMELRKSSEDIRLNYKPNEYGYDLYVMVR